MTEKRYPFDPKRVLAFLYAQAEQGEVHIERGRSSNLTAQAPDALLFIRWPSTYARLFEADGPSRIRLSEKRECIPAEVKARALLAFDPPAVCAETDRLRREW